MILMTRPLWRIFDLQEGAIADAGDFLWPRTAWRDNADFGRRAVCVLIPFGRDRDQFAIGIAGRDLDQTYGSQRASVTQLIAAALHLSGIGKLPQHVLEFGPIGVPQAEGARDLAHTDLPGLRAYKGQEFRLGRDCRGIAAGGFGQRIIRAQVSAIDPPNVRKDVRFCQRPIRPLRISSWLLGLLPWPSACRIWRPARLASAQPCAPARAASECRREPPVRRSG
jgi:hypothetical protein